MLNPVEILPGAPFPYQGGREGERRQADVKPPTEDGRGPAVVTDTALPPITGGPASYPVPIETLVMAQEHRDLPRHQQLDQESKEAEQIVRDLKARDAEVRRHEQAHKRAAGPYAGPAQYQYVRGPDGRLYAVSGEVSLNAGQEGDPKATIRKMEIIIRAALAPADPSAQDVSVANAARQTKRQAEKELRAERQQEQNESAGTFFERAISAYGQAADRVAEFGTAGESSAAHVLIA